MTSIADNIRVALYGQFGNDTRYEFTWPEPYTPLDAGGRFQWLRSFTDPRLLRSFPGARLCYLLWSTADGFYYGLITPQPGDSRGGMALTALFTGRRVFTDGRAAATCLKALHHLLLDEGVRDAARVEACLAAQPGLHTLAPATPTPAPAGQKAVTGYRTYRSEAELTELLTFRCQKAYAAYSHVVLVDDACTPAAGTPGGAVRIADRLKRQYIIVADDPATTQLSASAAEEGSELTVTYRKAGYQDVTRRLRVGSPDAIATYEGALVHIKPVAAANASFGIRLRVVAVAQGSRTPLPDCWVDVDGMRCPSAEITVTETQKAAGITLRVRVGATYYQPAEVTVSAATVTDGQTLTVTLQPQQGGATLVTRLFGLEWTATRELDQPTIARIAKEAPAQGYTVKPDRRDKNHVLISPSHSGRKKKSSPWLWVALGEALLILLLAAALVWPRLAADDEKLPEDTKKEEVTDAGFDAEESISKENAITENTYDVLYNEVKKNLLYFYDEQKWNDNQFAATQRNLEELYYHKDQEQTARELLSQIEQEVITPYYGQECSEDLRFIIEKKVNEESFDNFIDRLERQIKQWDKERQRNDDENIVDPKTSPTTTPHTPTPKNKKETTSGETIKTQKTKTNKNEKTTSPSPSNPSTKETRRATSD